MDLSRSKFIKRAAEGIFPSVTKSASRAMTRKLLEVVGDGNKRVPSAALVQKGQPWASMQKGTLDMSPVFDDAIAVSRSVMHPDLRGMGLGRKMYGKAIDDAARLYAQGGKYKWFTAGHKTSEDAVRVWESLMRRGYPIRQTNPAFGHQFQLDLGTVAEQRGYMKNSQT